MAYSKKVIAVTLITLIAGAVSSTEALATHKPVVRRPGFSETRIPQVQGRVPIRKNSDLEKGATAKGQIKANSSGNGQNETVSCGPENAQSDICRKAIQHR